MARAKTQDKRGEKPQVKIEKRAEARDGEFKLEWKRTQYENGLILWTQTRSVPESRDLLFHTYRESSGWAVSFDDGMSWKYGCRTPEEAMRVCEEIVRFRRSRRIKEIQRSKKK